MENLVLKFVTVEGTAQEFNIAANAEVCVVYPNGDVKNIKVTKTTATDRKDINEMTIDELRTEIRNSHSVYYKNKKKLEDLKKDEVANAEAIAKFDLTKLEEQKNRFEAADKLFEGKFPGEAKAIGAKGGSKGSGKVAEIEAIIATISASDLPADKKEEALAKLNTLVEKLKPKAKVEKTETTESTNTVDETVPADAIPSDVKSEDTATVDATETDTAAPAKGRFR